MAAPRRDKTPMESRLIPFDMDALIPVGALPTSAQAYISLSSVAALRSATTVGAISEGAASLTLTADPGLGALLILEPSGGKEERLKVRTVTPSAPNFICDIDPVTWYQHNSGVSVSYEPGRSARMLVDDTPAASGETITVQVRQGTHNLEYRVSVVALLNNGEVVEDEIFLDISDNLDPKVQIKQPTETRDLASNMAALLAEPHQNPGTTTLTSALAYAQTTTSTTTSLAAQANPNATTLSLTDHPGIGALLIIEPAGVLPTTAPEKVYVSAVSGSGPYTATISPSVEFVHNNGVAVTVFQGITPNFLTSATSTIQGLAVVNRARRGAAGRVFQVVWLATTSQTEQLQHAALVSVEEI